MPQIVTACPPGYAIRLRRPDDDSHLLRVENAAGRLFAFHGYPQIADDGFPNVQTFRDMMKGGETIVAVGRDGVPVGYAVANPLGAYQHLRELAVDPEHGRMGIGGALVKSVIDRAYHRGSTGVSLSTFRNVPFNQPFYEGLGFAELPLGNAPRQLEKAFQSEVPAGIAPSERLLMIFTLRE